jgi:hypothetical protein
MYEENIDFDSSILPDGCTAKYTMSHDESAQAPWEECDTLGAVEWVRDAGIKSPGQKVLFKEGRGRGGLLYDYQGAIKKARADGLSGSKAVEVVNNEFEWLRSYLNNDWHYVVLSVEIKDSDGHALHEDHIGYVQSDDESFFKEWFDESVDSAKKELEEKQRCKDMGIITV